ncbi:MAG: bifunctional phosphopantothenoylcysteine decarboxylase/phosphopantothenate--cysteine ligase CoaBC [Candidatus Methylopumilus sp.]|nr:bifunctional phosphopantothenoylcysteine decarboxylase/phosphopantothenate--cysteine ligase CoaBC [Candidatus Methylopumilus sp.]
MSNSHRIILGVTGGIAAYKAAELTRLLVKYQYDVQVVMTESATKFVAPLTFQALSGKEVLWSLWSDSSKNGMSHIETSRKSKLIIIAPASANFIAKLTHGFSDDLLSSICLARTCPIAVAPAMNMHMWSNPATQRNINQLKKDGVIFFGPDSGEQACGDIGLGRMIESEELLESINDYFTPKILKNKKILITSGGTIEMIDDVRGIANLSSGQMGSAIAHSALSMGAKVTLVTSSKNKNSKHIQTIYVKNVSEMHKEVMGHAGSQDIFISVAAISDFTPEKILKGKIKKDGKNFTLKLKPTIDILSDVSKNYKKLFKVGFAAESENLIENAKKKLISKNLDLVVANLVHESMGLEDAKVTLLDKKDIIDLPKSNKINLSKRILEEIAGRIN